jgi:frataxin
MDASEFEHKATQTLEGLFDALDDALGEVIEVDFDNSVLTIELQDGRQYVINKHGPNQELWMSSPISGAAHFSYDAATECWTSTRGGDGLKTVLATELKQLTGKDLAD